LPGFPWREVTRSFPFHGGPRCPASRCAGSNQGHQKNAANQRLSIRRGPAHGSRSTECGNSSRRTRRTSTGAKFRASRFPSLRAAVLAEQNSFGFVNLDRDNCGARKLQIPRAMTAVCKATHCDFFNSGSDKSEESLMRLGPE